MHLEALQELAVGISGERSVDEVLQSILHGLAQQPSVSRCSVTLAMSPDLRRGTCGCHIPPRCPIFTSAGEAFQETAHEHNHSERWHDDLLQGLGQGPGRHVLARMAPELRYVGRPDDVPRTARLPSRGTRPPWPWPIQPGLVRKRHGRVCRRSGSPDRGPGSQEHHDGGPLDWRRRSRALHRTARHEASRQRRSS